MHWTVGPLTVTPGARVDRFGLTDDWSVSPWLQADWQASPDLTVVVNAGLHHQFPEFAEMVGRRGDAGLRPERATPVDAGVEGRFGRTTRWQVTVYDREERDVVDLPGQYIQRVDGVLRPQSSTSRYDNRLDGSSRGVEFLLQRRSPDALSGWIAYSFGRTRYTDRVTGETFDGDFDQRHTLSVFGRYRISDRTSVNAAGGSGRTGRSPDISTSARRPILRRRQETRRGCQRTPAGRARRSHLPLGQPPCDAVRRGGQPAEP